MLGSKFVLIKACKLTNNELFKLFISVSLHTNAEVGFPLNKCNIDEIKPPVT